MRLTPVKKHHFVSLTNKLVYLSVRHSHDSGELSSPSDDVWRVQVQARSERRINLWVKGVNLRDTSWRKRAYYSRLGWVSDLSSPSAVCETFGPC